MKISKLARRTLIAAVTVACGLSAQTALAGPINWTNWTTTAPSQVQGSLTVGSTTVNVTYSGLYSFAQTSGGTNYWSPSAPYLSSAVSNAPPASDIIALSTGGTKTITFSQPVVDPLLALVSWNGNVVDFGVPIQFLSYGAGYWGNGTPALNGAGTGFTGNGEVHGVIRLVGTYSSISFTDTTEGWHGLTVGVSELANVVPEPASLALMGLGLAGIGMMRRKKA